jgi:hypothetical protein
MDVKHAWMLAPMMRLFSMMQQTKPKNAIFVTTE